MTENFAYEHELPCKNPNCKSHGTPHPNCKCYSVRMAAGGEVGGFCSSSRPHDKSCQYFADGGEAQADYIPDAEVTPEATVSAPTDTEQETQYVSPEEVTPEGEEYVKISDVTPNEEKYSTTGQKTGAAVEGFGEGVGGPLFTLPEVALGKLGVPGLSAEDIAGREEANPIIHGTAEVAGVGASLYTGVGEFALIAKALQGVKVLKAAEDASKMVKAGYGILKGAITSGVITGGDEVSKSILGQQPPDDAAVASALTSVGLSTLLGAGASAAGSLVSAGLTKAAESKLGANIIGFLHGLGSKASAAKVSANIKEGMADVAAGKLAGHPAAVTSAYESHLYDVTKSFNEYMQRQAKTQGYKQGVKLQDYITKAVIGGSAMTAAYIGGSKGYDEGGIGGAIGGAMLGGLSVIGTAKAGSYALGKMNPALGAAMLGVAQQDPTKLQQTISGIASTIDYANHANSGLQKINSSIEKLFQVGSAKTISAMTKRSDEDSNNANLKKLLDEENVSQSLIDAMQPQTPIRKYAAGGEVAAERGARRGAFDGLGENLPTHDILLNAAKMRVTNYLQSQKPTKELKKTAFDDDSFIDHESHKSYDKAIGIANNPLSVLDHVNNGTIDLDHIKHFRSMYPEIHEFLTKKITERITQAQEKGEKPRYAIRQGLSALLGVPLDGCLTQQNMAAAQGVFASKQQAQGGPTQQQKQQKAKKGTAPLSKTANRYQTPLQDSMEKAAD